MLSDFAFESVISLGVDCRVRFQISRFFDALRALPPDGPGPADAEAPAGVPTGTNLFDWNMVWFADVSKTIEGRFEGMFARATLKPMPNHPDIVVDGRYDIMYSHLFGRKDGEEFAGMVARGYDKAAKVVTFLRDRFVARLEQDSPTLYVRCQGHEHEAQRFCRAVETRYPRHRFHLVLVDVQDETAGFVAREAAYSIYRMTGKVNKPPNAAWTGDDAEWTALFREICREARVGGRGVFGDAAAPTR